jgi:site-specific DNA recombinase
LLHALVARIDVRPNTVEIAVRPAARPEIARSDRDLRRLPVLSNTPTILLSVPAQVRRTGMETRLLIQSASDPAHREPDRSLLRLLGQARRFADLVLAGRGETITKLAGEAGVSPSYFTRVLRLSFLAPAIVRTILQGRQPPQLTANRLMLHGTLALGWSQQQALLDLA